jgi:arginine decarboxylase
MEKFLYTSEITGTKSGFNNLLQGIIVGNRIPKDYFVTKGLGESDITIHAGSYHLALKNAGIEMANIITYSSILPDIATKISKPKLIRHGEVMETIMAVANGTKGEEISAGIIYGWLYNRKNGIKHGGLVCEHNGNYSKKQIKKKLYASLNELYYNGFEQEFVLDNIELIIQSYVPKKEFGTAMVALCFTNYIVPVLGVNSR